MARLTEEMVIARSKQSDLSSIKKLNCWGAELGDVSLLRRMPNVEVLAFSINKIRSLQDFAGCRLLRELYVRKNEIRDLREIRYLRHLPALTSLWLDENPCTHHPQYRLTVLRNLPRLEKLDNVDVQQEELEEAQRRGSLIDSDDEGYPQTQEAYAESVRSGGSARAWRGGGGGGGGGGCGGGGGRARSGDSSPEPEREPEPDDYRDRHVAGHDQGSDSSEAAREPGAERERERERAEHQCPLSPTRRAAPAPAPALAPAPARAGSPDDERLEHPAMTRSHYDPRWARERDRDPPLRHSVSAHSVKEYSYGMNGDCRHVTSPHDQYGERGDNRSEYAASTVGREREWEREPARERERDGYPSAVMADHRGFTRRPVTRNSNLLSAVLCLVKELDYPSLEVAEMAVRCRMDELANGQ